METQISALAPVAGIVITFAMLSIAGLVAWRDWIGLRREQLAMARGGALERETDEDYPEASARIEVADLKERIRKLEAIANGVDL